MTERARLRLDCFVAVANFCARRKEGDDEKTPLRLPNLLERMEIAQDLFEWCFEDGNEPPPLTQRQPGITG